MSPDNPSPSATAWADRFDRFGTTDAMRRFIPVALADPSPRQPATVMAVELPGGIRIRSESVSLLRNIGLLEIQPVVVATYIEELTFERKLSELKLVSQITTRDAWPSAKKFLVIASRFSFKHRPATGLLQQFGR